jgi:hypothetical protein
LSSPCGPILVLANIFLPMAVGQIAGPQACAPCHRSQFEKQSISHHAKALRPIAESPLLEFFRKNPRPPQGDISYEVKENSVTAQAGPGPDALVARLVWAFGAGAQGITPVGTIDGRYIENRLSYYGAAHGLGLTFGHRARAATPDAELGIAQDSRTIFQCFNCHATGVQAGPNLTAMISGVTCERCHGPGQAHIAAAKSGAAPEAIRKMLLNPGRFAATAQIQMCGECHRLPVPGETSPEPEMEDPVSVRFAPIGLLASRCFVEGKQLSCLTCHDPHSDVIARTDQRYSERCRACHPPSATPASASQCPRAKNRDCLGCHMRQASLGPYLRFTDHRIRVYR